MKWQTNWKKKTQKERKRARLWNQSTTFTLGCERRSRLFTSFQVCVYDKDLLDDIHAPLSVQALADDEGQQVAALVFAVADGPHGELPQTAVLQTPAQGEHDAHKQRPSSTTQRVLQSGEKQQQQVCCSHLRQSHVHQNITHPLPLSLPHLPDFYRGLIENRDLQEVNTPHSLPSNQTARGVCVLELPAPWRRTRCRRGPAACRRPCCNRPRPPRRSPWRRAVWRPGCSPPCRTPPAGCWGRTEWAGAEADTRVGRRHSQEVKLTLEALQYCSMESSIESVNYLLICPVFF